ncbi:zinc ABC transporter substrate-binding protein [uncultured Lamprocystis sp.]|jgi:zinc transport system substrate-binding protein|uniref:metal ABC transporter solute-binding protein, Zn/Mn family n=1 Tax=uncultured Lamprocystis sp. TaxID=543132 RepID=UPI0025DCA7D1|nr:zinc ABC transporter substrate-binding protein [uncultured Lamprocystis sp.]
MFLALRLLVPMMLARARPAALVVCCMVAASGLGLPRPAWAADPGGQPLSVFTTVVPLATFVERIGGDQVRVQALVRPGQNPHAYEPSPRQIAALADADLYVRVGMSLEDAWLPRIRATNARMRVLDARDNIRLRPSDVVQTIDDSRGLADHDHDGGAPDQHQEPSHADHGHEALDTHVWTSPPLVKSMGAGIRDALIALRPEQADAFRANYDRFAADLDALDAAILARLAPVKERRFMVFHPAWGYYAETYGLTQVSVEYEGKEPGGRALAGLIDAARANAVTVVLVQPQFSPRAAEQIAAAIGGRVESVDPLAADYFATLRRLTDLIAGPATP